MKTQPKYLDFVCDATTTVPGQVLTRKNVMAEEEEEEEAAAVEVEDLVREYVASETWVCSIEVDVIVTAVLCSVQRNCPNVDCSAERECQVFSSNPQPSLVFRSAK